MLVAELPERIANKIDVTPVCWEWVGSRSWNGYGRLMLGRRYYTAHRLVWESLVGPIPNGLDLDHLCSVRHCVNPDHLEPVTRKENLRRSPVAARNGYRNRIKTHCPQGHPYDDENTYTSPGQRRRQCRACKRDWDQRDKAIKKAGLL